MKNIKIYDDKKSFDRFTVIFMNQKNCNGLYDALAMNETPFHSQGFGQHTMAEDGKHLGKKIKLEDLPIDCQKFIKMNLE